MSDEEHDIMITQFQDLTGQDAERSRFYLESSGWEIELAIGSFYEADAMEVEDFEAARPPQPEAAKPMAKPEEKPKSDRAPTGASSRQSASNINTFASRFGKEKPDDGDGDSSDSDEEEGQAFYAGGSVNSGQEILGPKKGKESDFVKGIFKKAREHGAEAVDQNSPPGQAGASSRPTFSGSGFKLGSTEGEPTQVVPGASSKKDEKPREFALKMWQDGFSIDDGPLRDYNDQENREFLTDVMKGRIPRELIREARGGEVMVNMEDHKDKPFEKPKVTSKPFQGSGNVLGSIAPAVVANDSSSSAHASGGSAALSEADAQKRVNVDTSKTMTTLQVRLMSGGRLIVKLNDSNTISDLRQYIRLLKPDTPPTFSLHTTFPNKEHTDDSATLKDAGLLGAAILMRPK